MSSPNSQYFESKVLRSRRSVSLLVSLAVLTGLVFFLNENASAQGNLLITPRRVVFEGSKKSVDLNLANTGHDTATYIISIIQIRMRDDGGFETITEPDPDQRFADRFIRFFPRSVTLGPNEAQVVKVQLVRSGELAPGEYRSHFYFRAIPKAKPLGEEEKSADSTAISVKLTPVFGITIPAIIRIGESSVKTTLSDLALEMVSDAIPRLKLTFNRIGNMSVYGDLTVDYLSLQGKVTRVGIANGIAVYTPNQLRHFQMNLNMVKGVDFHSGKLIVSFSTPSDIKTLRIAEAELLLR